MRRRIAVLSVSSLALLALTVAPGRAAAPQLKACTGAGSLNVVSQNNGTVTWALTGSGFCGTVFPITPLQNMSATGSGTSSGLGLCGNTLVVQNLSLNVAVTLTDVVSNTSQTFNEVWSAPITTFPLVSPFLVSGPGSAGVGVIFTRIFLNCPPGGTPSLQFDWTQSLT